jgi:ubiquinone/menaquinone biosynthesis C-methylase UbiE
MPNSWFTYDFGYLWPLTWGHLIVCAVGVAIGVIAWWRGWAVWTRGVAAIAAVWGLIGATAMHQGIQINEPMRVVTAAFAPSGGRVLDLGAGSGRATIGLLLARPGAAVTALDLYQGYFGIDGNTPARLRANAKIAGVDNRVDVQVADMRALPFSDASFDAVMSVAAIDHLRWPDIEQTMRETSRVLRAGGQFLIVSLNADAWVRIAIPTSIHGGFWGSSPNRQRWRDTLTRAGFEVVEIGTAPATVYFLARRRS